MTKVYGSDRATIKTVNGRAYTGPGLSSFGMTNNDIRQGAYETLDGRLNQGIHLRNRRVLELEWKNITQEERDVLGTFFPSLNQDNKMINNNRYIVGYTDFGDSSKIAYSTVYIGNSFKDTINFANGDPSTRLHTIKMNLIEIQ